MVRVANGYETNAPLSGFPRLLRCRAVPKSARVTRFRMGGTQFLTMSVPSGAPRVGFPLTPAERQVVALLIEGKTNAQIARARRTSARTVANQLASIFKKLSVGSRAELIAMGVAG